jgi:hypothetical protein
MKEVLIMEISGKTERDLNFSHNVLLKRIVRKMYPEYYVIFKYIDE